MGSHVYFGTRRTLIITNAWINTQMHTYIHNENYKNETNLDEIVAKFLNYLITFCL